MSRDDVRAQGSVLLVLFELLVRNGEDLARECEEDQRDDLTDEALLWCMRDSDPVEQLCKIALELGRARHHQQQRGRGTHDDGE